MDLDASGSFEVPQSKVNAMDSDQSTNTNKSTCDIEGNFDSGYGCSTLNLKVIEKPFAAVDLVRTNSTDGDERKLEIPWEHKRNIVRFNPEWPVCGYHEISKRVGKSIQYERPKASQYLARINNWSEHRSVSVDGMSGTGKSTLVNSMNRKSMKINNHCSDITSGSQYNYAPLRSLEYIMFHALCDTGDAFVVWDRCRYSNIIFSFVHHLMCVYKGRSIPGPDNDEPLLFINNMALATGLFMTVTYLESICSESQHILFIVCSDIPLVMQALLHRGGVNDVYNAKERNYQIAQYHVYRYFAVLLDAPLLDLSVLFGNDLTLAEIHVEIKSRIDIPQKLDQNNVTKTPKRDESLVLHEFCNRRDDTMVYAYSKK